MKHLFLLIIKLYRQIVSPFLGANCRFYPSCSSYAEEALKRHSLWRAVFLSAKRILRCHPWNGGGVDFVPGGNVSEQK